MSTVLRSGLHFGECPRWHDGRLWYSDFFDGVHAITIDGQDERVVQVPGEPAGLGWLPGGDLLIAERTRREVLRWDGSAVSPYASLLPHATFHANDMLVDGQGRAYVGNFGFDLDAFLAEHGFEGIVGEPGPTPAALCLVTADAKVRVAAGDLLFPNGMALAPDGRTLIVAETLGLRLSAFDVAPDGSLSGRRVWADLSARLVAPDGICLDAEGAVWAATALSPSCVRIAEGGEILDEVTVSQIAYACMLGGPAGRHLFVMTAPESTAAIRRASTEGGIEVTEVTVPHAGLP